MELRSPTVGASISWLAEAMPFNAHFSGMFNRQSGPQKPRTPGIFECVQFAVGDHSLNSLPLGGVLEICSFASFFFSTNFNVPSSVVCSSQCIQMPRWLTLRASRQCCGKKFLEQGHLWQGSSSTERILNFCALVHANPKTSTVRSKHPTVRATASNCRTMHRNRQKRRCHCYLNF